MKVRECWVGVVCSLFFIVLLHVHFVCVTV